jgi:hypothetical protein
MLAEEINVLQKRLAELQTRRRRMDISDINNDNRKVVIVFCCEVMEAIILFHKLIFVQVLHAYFEVYAANI